MLQVQDVDVVVSGADHQGVVLNTRHEHQLAEELTADWMVAVTRGGGQTDPVVDDHAVDLRDLQTGPEGWSHTQGGSVRTPGGTNSTR